MRPRSGDARIASLIDASKRAAGLPRSFHLPPPPCSPEAVGLSVGSLAYLGTYLGTYVPTAVPTLPWYWSGVGTQAGTQAGKSLVTSLHLVRYFQSTRAGFRFGSLLWTTSVPRFCKLSIYSQYCILLHVGNLLFLTNAVQLARARHRECTAKSVEPLSSWIAP